MRRQLLPIGLTAGVLVAVGLAGCAQDPPTTAAPATVAESVGASAAEVVAPLLALTSPGQWRSLGDDRFEVWVCRVPDGATAPIYGGLSLRLPFTPEGITAVVAEHVTPYFESLSHGQYRPLFVPGGEAALAVDDPPQVCIDQAIAGAGPDTRGVLVVADAEHGADQSGGFGSGGGDCTTAAPCAVAESRRFAYVGASDFHPDWGAAPPMDLVEHELGHSLGWPHSAVDSDGSYLSGLDVMSNSAAPRDTEPERRDAPGALGVNLVTAGWLPLGDVWAAPAGGGSVRLAPSAATNGTRLAVVPCCPDGLLTIEWFEADGRFSHLPQGGVAVHEVRWSVAGAITISPLVGTAPFVELLQPGEELSVGDWVITVGEAGLVTVTRAELV